MTTKNELRGALVSLSQTLSARVDDVAHEAEIFLRWFGTKQGCNATLGRAVDWQNLPPQSAAYSAPLASLVNATNRLAIVHGSANWLAALDNANDAIFGVAAMLDNPPPA